MELPTRQQLIPLHVHTHFSVLDGASGISEYLKWCKDNGSPALGVTDHGWVIGLRELIDKSKASGITPLPGCEFYLVPPANYPFKGKPYDYFHVTAWGINEAGYRNILKLGSISFQRDTIQGKKRVISRFGSEKPRITFEELFEHQEGLVLGSGCLIGSINKALLNGEWSGAIQNLSRLMSVFRGRLFIELMPHQCFVKGTSVWMADGTKKEIEKISIGDWVLSYSEKLRIVRPKKVISLHKNPAKESEFIANYFYGQGTQAQKTPVICTKDHHFFDGKEWKPIEECRRVSIMAKKISSWEKSAILGTMLGDASVVRGGAYQYSQSEPRKEMAFFIKEIVNGSDRTRKPRPGQTWKNVSYCINSRHPYFESFRTEWYPDGKKIVPRSIELDEVSIAWWFMDDGTTSFRNYKEKKYINSRLCTQGFCESDVDHLIFLLRKKGLVGSKVKSRYQFAISFDQENTKKLHEMIADHVLPCAQYKLRPECRDKYIQKSVSKDLDVYSVIQFVEVPLPSRIGRDLIDYSAKYDLEIEDDHCYFVGDGILVHNCTHDYDRKTKAFRPNECTDFAPDGDLQRACNLSNIQIAREFNLPLLMTVDSHFVKPDEKTTQDLLLQNGDPDGWRFYNSYHMMNTEQAWEHWRLRYGSDIEQRKIFAEAVENNHLLADMAKGFNIKDPYRQPVIDLQGEPNLESLILKKIAKHGRMKNDPKWYSRLEYEMSVICRNGTVNFAPYFLFLEQWAEWTRKNSILSAPGRGSGAGSLLCYLLKITHLDPFKQHLPFERFLSLGRINRKKFPDIDWDLSDRDPLLSKLKEVYGSKMAQCSTHGTLKIKSAIKDACRVILRWNSDDPRVNEITKPIPMTPTGVPDQAFLMGYTDAEGHIHEGYLDQDKRLQAFFTEHPQIQDMVLKLLGIPRSVGRHACFAGQTLVDNNGAVSFIKDASFIQDRSVRVWSSGEKETILICLNNGVSIRCTPEHVFITPEGEIEAKDLLNHEVNFKPFSGVSGSEEMDLDLCFALGWGLNDGNYIETHEKFCFYFTPKKDDEARSRIQSFFHRIGVAFYQDKKRKDEWFTGKIGLPDKFRKKSKNVSQRLPEWFWSLSFQCQREFLRGFFSANGFVLSTRPRVGFKVASKLLASDICSWFLAQGVEVSAQFKEAGTAVCYGRKIKSNGSVEVVFSTKEDKKWFALWVGFEQTYKNNRLIEIVENKSPYSHSLQTRKKLRVVFIEPAGICEVFDFNEPINNQGYVNGVLAHNSAFFISDAPISESVPTCVISDEICTQYTAAWAEKSGLIKFDFLRVNTLSDISSAIRLIQKRLGYRVEEREVSFNGDKYSIVEGELEIDQLPMRDGRILDVYDLPEDPAVFDDLCLGKTETVFQLQTSALTSLTKRIRPRSIEEISALVALVRPGPMNGFIEDGVTTMTDAYIKRKHGEMSVTYPHPDMEPIVRDTYGVLAYQEQVASCFSDLLGYTAEEADEMRERIGKKKKQDMEAMIPALRARIKEKGWTANQEEMFVTACIAASSYSFNRAHSASYAAVAYQCAFIKHHYPLEWWTAVLQNAKVDDIKEKGYAAAVKDLLVLPHVNGPMKTFELRDDGKIHAPLYLIDGVADAACEAIYRAQKDGPFTSFQDFYDRVNKASVNMGIMHSMILCGAFDLLHPGEDPKNLTWIYHALRRVQTLKIGKDKRGPELMAAVAEYLKKGGTIDVPDLFQDKVELEVKRMTLLPIHRANVLRDFPDFMRAKGILADKNGVTTAVREAYSVLVCPNLDALSRFKNDDKKVVSFVGFLTEAEEFSYPDKRTKKKVKALKFKLSNDGDSLECVLWPKFYDVLKRPVGRIVFAWGKVVEGRDPGSLSLFVSGFENF